MDSKLNNNCLRIFFSWIFVVAGFYTFNIAGLLYSFLPFSIAAILRGNSDEEIKSYFYNNNLVKLFIAAYYFIFMIVVLLNQDIFKDGLGYEFALFFGLPIGIAVAFYDLKTCILKK